MTHRSLVCLHVPRLARGAALAKTAPAAACMPAAKLLLPCYRFHINHSYRMRGYGQIALTETP
jgi:hypothetical protein